MKRIFFILFVLASVNSFTQNWALVNDSTSYFYSSQGQYFEGFQIDTNIWIGSKEALIPNKILQKINHQCGISVDNIFGTAFIIDNFGTHILTSKNDTVHLPKFFNTVNSWLLFRFSSSHYLEAVKISCDTFRFNNQIDSLYKFKLIQYDSLGIVQNSIFSDTLSVSKSHGFINTYDWANFSDSVPKLFERVNYKLLKIRDIYDFNTGDEFHVKTSHNISRPDSYENIKILTRKDTLNSIIYSKEVKYRHQTVDYSTPNPTLTTHAGTYIKNDTIRSLDSIVGYMPNAIIKENFTAANQGVFYNIPNRTNYMIYNPYYFDQSSNCYFLTTVSPVMGVSYIEGCGKYISYNSAGSGHPSTDYLIYFKKGNETWGQPRILTGIENKSDLKTIGFYPNPSSGKVNLINASNDRESIIKIRDLNGKLLKFINAYQVKQIDISDLSNGIYLIELHNNSEVSSSKLIVNR